MGRSATARENIKRLSRVRKLQAQMFNVTNGIRNQQRQWILPAFLVKVLIQKRRLLPD